MKTELEELYIKIGTKSGTDFDLVSLGEMFNGLDGVIKEIYGLSNIQGEFTLKVKNVEEGSVILTLGGLLISNLPFEKPVDLLNFLLIAAPEIYKEISTYLATIDGIHKTVNEIGANYPVDTMVALYLLKKFVPGIINLAPKFKENNIVKSDDRIPQVYATKLHSMIVSKKFKKIVNPIIENKIEYINFNFDKNKDVITSINSSNFDGYLSDDEKILPDFINGQTVKLKGEIVAIQSTRGEILKFRALGIDSKYQLLVVRLDDGKSSENYLEFYKKMVEIEAEVFRNSMYKKPEIIIKNINLLQENLV